MRPLPLNAHKTAMHRKLMSVPVKELIIKQRFKKSAGFTILDFGCGHGKDVDELREEGYTAYGYDPYWRPATSMLGYKYNIVLCTYVFNVVNAPTRLKLVRQLKSLTKPGGTVYITVRRDVENYKISKKGTHQFNVKLPFKIVKKTSSYCIYKIDI